METSINAEDDPSLPPPRASSAAFTIDFGEGRNVDLNRHKSLVERYEKRHRRGLSASKVEGKTKTTSTSTTPTAHKKLSFTRKSSSSVDGSSYDVSPLEDQRIDRAASIGPTSPLTRKLSNKRERLALPLKSAPGATERMVQSITDYDLNSASNNCGAGTRHMLKSIVKQMSSPECEMRKLDMEEGANGHAQVIRAGDGFVDCLEFDFDRRSDSVSEAGTYTIDADVYTTEQKERMSIDRDFRILDPVAGALKAAEYVNQLAELNGNTTHNGGGVQLLESGNFNSIDRLEKMEVGGEDEELEAFEGYRSDENYDGAAKGKLQLLSGNKNQREKQSQHTQHLPAQNNAQKPKKPTSLLSSDTPLKPHLQRKHHNISTTSNNELHNTHINQTKPTDLPPQTVRYMAEFPITKLSPILSPTTQQQLYEGSDVDNLSKTFTKIMFPNPKGACNVCTATDSGGGNVMDQGSVISVTSSGAFRARNDLQRKSSLTKSDIYVEAYTDHQMELRIKQQNTPANTLSANLVHMTSTVTPSKVSNLPPPIGGKSSPSKIPSPMMGNSRPRSRNNCTNDATTAHSCLDTECYLKPTQQLLSQLEKRLEVQQKQQQQQQQQQQVRWNNDCSSPGSGYLVKRPFHVRHNSLDSRNAEMANKLEHFQRNNLLCIDQTTAAEGVMIGNGFSVVAAAHAPVPPHQHAVVRKVQNSPNNSPIRRSSSFSAKNQQLQQQQQQIVMNRLSGGQGAVSQMQQKEMNVHNSPLLSGGAGSTLQKSASTTNIKGQGGGGGAVAVGQGRRGSVTSAEASPLITNHYQSISPYHHHQQLLQTHHKIDRSKYGISTSSESSSEDDEDHDGTTIRLQQHQTLGATAQAPKQRKDITTTRYNRAFSLRRGRLDGAVGEGGGVGEQQVRCPNTPEMRRKFVGERAASVDRKPTAAKHFHDIQPRYLQHTQPASQQHHQQHPQSAHSNNNNNNNSSTYNNSRSGRHGSAPPGRRDTNHLPSGHSRPQRLGSAGGGSKGSGASGTGGPFHRGDPGRLSMGKGTGGGGGPMTNSQKTIRTTVPTCTGGGNKEGTGGGGGLRTKQPGPRCNSSLSSKEMEFANWKRRKSYDPMKAAAQGKKRVELAKKQTGTSMTQSFTETTNQNSCDSSPTHSNSVHRSQSFHGTAVASQQQRHHHMLLSSGDEDDLEDSNEELTLSAEDDVDDNGFSPPTPSPSHQLYPSPWQREMQRQTTQEQQHADEVLLSGSDATSLTMGGGTDSAGAAESY